MKASHTPCEIAGQMSGALKYLPGDLHADIEKPIPKPEDDPVTKHFRVLKFYEKNF